MFTDQWIKTYLICSGFVDLSLKQNAQYDYGNMLMLYERPHHLVYVDILIR